MTVRTQGFELTFGIHGSMCGNESRGSSEGDLKDWDGEGRQVAAVGRRNASHRFRCTASGHASHAHSNGHAEAPMSSAYET